MNQTRNYYGSNITNMGCDQLFDIADLTHINSHDLCRID